MRFRALIVALLGLCVAVSTLASIASLANTKNILLSESSTNSQPSPAMTNILTTGKVHRLFTMKETWQEFPGPPPLQYIIDPPAAWVMFVIISMTFYIGRYRLKYSFATVALACMLGSLLPYTMGALAVTQNAAVGPWSKTMLASLLYGSIACTIFATTNFFKVHSLRSKFLQQLEHNKEILKKKVA